jgi:hypothetical protein
MKLLTHSNMDKRRLQSLQTAVDRVEAAKLALEEATTTRDRARKEVPNEKQAPTDRRKLAAWKRKVARREECLAVADETVLSALEELETTLRDLSSEGELFRQYALELVNGKALAANRAAANVLTVDAFIVDCEDLVHAERKPREDQEPTFFERLILRQQLLASRREFTVRLRIGDERRWSYVQDRYGDLKNTKHNLPMIPCMTMGEAEKLGCEIAERVASKFAASIPYIVEVIDLSTGSQCGTSRYRSHGLLKPVID